MFSLLKYVLNREIDQREDILTNIIIKSPVSMLKSLQPITKISIIA
jgi:hypothetical protein